MCVHSVTSVASDSLRHHGLSPIRLLCPWDSPGKTTAVGCLALLQGIFLTHGSNLHLLRLTHWRQILYPVSLWGCPSQQMDREHFQGLLWQRGSKGPELFPHKYHMKWACLWNTKDFTWRARHSLCHCLLDPPFGANLYLQKSNSALSHTMLDWAVSSGCPLALHGRPKTCFSKPEDAWGSPLQWVIQFHSDHSSCVQAACASYAGFSRGGILGLTLRLVEADPKPRNILKARSKATA